jgi:hypothetical protein
LIGGFSWGVSYWTYSDGENAWPVSDRKNMIWVHCPKAGLIQTEIQVSKPKLSESKPHSDRNPVIQAKAVRKQASFRQESEYPSQSCPKARLIQTGIQVSKPKLSESKPHSDRNPSIQAKTVRKQASFRQESEYPSQSCPKANPIQTGIRVSKPKLFKSEAHSDRIPSIQAKAVRKASLIQTGIRVSEPKLSESESHLDRNPVIQVKAVQKQASFRQESEYPSQSCPKGMPHSDRNPVIQAKAVRKASQF